MNELKKDMIDYFVICTNEFAERYAISAKDALLYLNKYKGLDYLEEFYKVEHTLSFDDTIDHLTIICRNNGGTIV